jgi:hypothetical protein
MLVSRMASRTADNAGQVEDLVFLDVWIGNGRPALVAEIDGCRFSP